MPNRGHWLSGMETEDAENQYVNIVETALKVAAEISRELKRSNRGEKFN